jgi:glycoprotease/Kae1 family metallohydrolase
MTGDTRILAIESSCDETAAAVVENGRRMLAGIVASQASQHARYGGVFPEAASRMHIEAIYSVVADTLTQAHVGLEAIDAIAVTRGPGLAGSLVVGMAMAKGMALASGLPLLGINHLEAHLYSIWLVEDEPEPAFPLLALIVSGGHSELILMRDHLTYERLGGTLDDAAGEAFDKVARLLGLGYPGGPAVRRPPGPATTQAFSSAPGWKDHYDFSFSQVEDRRVAWVRAQPDLEAGSRRPGQAFLSPTSPLRSGVGRCPGPRRSRPQRLSEPKRFWSPAGLSQPGRCGRRFANAPRCLFAYLRWRCADSAAMIGAWGTFAASAGSVASTWTSCPGRLPADQAGHFGGQRHKFHAGLVHAVKTLARRHGEQRGCLVPNDHPAQLMHTVLEQHRAEGVLGRRR